MNKSVESFLIKFKNRKRWRLILSACSNPATMGKIYANQSEKSLSYDYLTKLVKLFVAFSLLEKKLVMNSPPEYTLTPRGKKILEVWPVQGSLEKLMEDAKKN